jgi:hypothetical protein
VVLKIGNPITAYTGLIVAAIRAAPTGSLVTFWKPAGVIDKYTIHGTSSRSIRCGRSRKGSTRQSPTSDAVAAANMRTLFIITSSSGWIGGDYRLRLGGSSITKIIWKYIYDLTYAPLKRIGNLSAQQCESTNKEHGSSSIRCIFLPSELQGIRNRDSDAQN